MSPLFGVQPARQCIADHGLTVSAAAEKLGENRGHFYRALLGYVAPCRRLRRTLPELLDTPLEELFTAESLAHQYGTGRGDYTLDRPVVRTRRRQAARS